MHPDLTKLLDLQAKDIVLLDVDRRLQELDTELAGLDQQLDKARDAITAALILERREYRGTARFLHAPTIYPTQAAGPESIQILT